MKRLNIVRAFQIVIVTLSIVLFVQLVNAADCMQAPTHADVPPWVLDRQQYEITYVYTPTAMQNQTVEPLAAEWVAVRLQYDPTYLQREATRQIPEWVLDRQQYETTYVYPPNAINVNPTQRCLFLQLG